MFFMNVPALPAKANDAYESINGAKHVVHGQMLSLSRMS